MKLSTSVCASVGCAAVVATAAWHYVSATDPDFLLRNMLAGPWILLGGAGGVAVLAYAVLSFALVTGGAYHGLDRARARLAGPAVDPKLLPGAWRRALTGTDFEALGAYLPGEDLAVPPLVLLRVLRHEIWRIYGVRLLATQLVTVALAAIALAAAPFLEPAAPALAGDGRLEEIAAALAMALAIASWLLIDGAIRRLAVTVSRLVASWEASLREQPVASARQGKPVGGLPPPVSDTMAAAVDRLTAGLAARAAGDAQAAAPALAGIEAALRESTARLEALIGALARAAEQRGVSSDGDAGGMGEALIQLATAVDKLADPLLRRMRLLDASDRRLLTVLRRQEEAVGSVGTKWGELVNALQAMSAGLDSFARAAASRQDQDQHLLSSEPVEPGALSDELQELLDEMSDVDETPSRRAAT